MEGAGVRGVVVAGGLGTRLGLGRPKALVVLHHATLLERASDLLAPACDEIVVAAPAAIGLELPPGARPTRRVIDRAPGGGPLAGVVAALENRTFRVAVVLGVDFPFVETAFVRGVVERLSQCPNLRALVPAPGGRLQPLVAAYTPEAASALAAAFEAGERSIVRAVERLQPTVIQDDELASSPGGAAAFFFNLNTREDLLAAERRIVAGEGVS